MCKYLSTAAEEIGADTFFGSGPGVDEEENGEVEPVEKWRKFRVNAVQTCEILMARKLDEWEKVTFYLHRSQILC